MNLDRMLLSKVENEVNNALDFCSFMLRYNSDIQYQDFSDNPETVEKVKRGESFRTWGDIEDLGNNHEALSKNFGEHEKTVSKAFQELYNHIEKIKDTLSEKITENKNEISRINNAIDRMRDNERTMKPSKTELPSRSEMGQAEDAMLNKTWQDELDQIERFINEKVIRRIELLENHEDDITQKIQNFNSKMKVEIEKSDKIEDQLKEQLDIISTVNKKTNNNHQTFEELKKLIHNKINRLESLILNKESDQIPTFADLKVSFEKIHKLEEQVMAMKTYQNELDEVFSLQSKEMDSLIKMTANNNYIKIRDIEAKLENAKSELVSSQNMINIQFSEFSKDMEMVKKNR